jgi:chromosome segregation ATPase
MAKEAIKMRKKDKDLTAVLLEEIRDQVQTVAEGLVGLRAHVTSEISALRTEMNERFNLVELAIKGLSVRVGNLEKGQRNLEIGQAEIKNEIKEMKLEIRKIHFRLDDHEARLPKPFDSAQGK